MEFITRHYPGTAPLDLYHTLVSSLHTAHSIGGNVAENTGGVHRLKCGLTVHTPVSYTHLDVYKRQFLGSVDFN